MNDEPWKSEKNHEIFSYKCFICEIRRNNEMKHLCGYVYLPKNHPEYKNKDLDYFVHGGITASSLEPCGEWRIGFDCAHANDLIPTMPSLGNGTYRDWEYVENQIHLLVDQLIVDIEEERIIEWNLTIKNRLAIKILSQ